MKFLLLSFLLSFQVFSATTFKAKSAVSVAGGYVTSLNKFDGSFELGTSNFTVSTGTLTQEANATMEGNYVGSWLTTAAGTFDSIAMTISATNTFEMKFIATSTDSANTYVCAVVNTVENACKLFANTTGQQQVSWIGQLNTGDSVKFRIKYAGTSATIKADNFKIEPWTPQVASLTQAEYASYTGYVSGTTVTVYRNLNPATNASLLISHTSSRFTALQGGMNCRVVANNAIAAADQQVSITWFNSAGTQREKSSAGQYRANYGSPAVIEARVDVGDYFTSSNSGSLNDDTTANFSITCSKSTDNIIQTWQDGSEWTAYTPTLQGWSSLSTSQFYWKRDGSDLLLRGKFVGVTGSGSNARIYFPSGLVSAGTSIIGSTQRCGQWFRVATVAVTHGGGVLLTPSQNYVEFMQAGTFGSVSINSETPILGNDISVGDGLDFSCRIPINGWSSTPALLALPISKENVFSSTLLVDGATINNPTVISKSSDFLNSATYSSNRRYDINFAKLGLTVAPVIVASLGLGDPTVVKSIEILAVTASTAQFLIGLLDDVPYRIFFSLLKQSPDYTPPGVFVGNVAKDYSASVDASEVISNVTDNFITSCTNAAPSVCTLATNKFAVAPFCLSNPLSTTTVAVVSTTTNASVTVQRTDAATPFNLFCQMK